MGKVIRKCKIDENIPLIRLDKYLGSRFSYYSREKWKNLISKGLVFVNGENVRYRKLVKKGDEIIYHITKMKEPKVNKNVRVIYDDGDLIIVNKPPNLPVIPSGKYYYNTLHTIMSKKLNMSVRMLNRIDRETSGAVIMCRSHEMASKVSTMIKKNQIKKIYISIVESQNKVIDKNYFTVEGNMIESPSIHFRRYQIMSKREGKYSKTKFKVKLKSENNWLLLCRLFTGRMHQIRVHLNHLNLFMVGDKIYGKHGPKIFDEFIKSDNYKLPKDMFERQALHCYKLIFKHPITNEVLKIKAKLPKDMKNFIRKNMKQLDKI